MHVALRPFVTSGIALVGASVIAVAPVIPTPTDIQIPNPVTQLEQDVQLAANIEDVVNSAIYSFVARPTVQGAELLGRLLAPIIGDEEAYVLPLAALGLAGPLISGGGALGTALQNLVDSDNFEEVLHNLIGFPGTLTDGFVNGGYGPDLAPLVKDILIHLEPGLGLLPTFPTVLAGGLINDRVVDGFSIPSYPYFIPTQITLPGTISTLQSLVEQLFGLFGENQMVTATLAAPEESRPIEDGVNTLTFAVVKGVVSIAQLGAPVVQRILDLPTEDAAKAAIALGVIGLMGPLIGGAGGTGHALQDLVNSDGLEDFVINTLDVPKLVIGGSVNGVAGDRPAGPDLGPIIAPNVPDNLRPKFYGGGFIHQAELPPPAGTDLTPPFVVGGTIPTLQGLVGQLLPSPAVESTNLKIAGGGEGAVTNDDEQKAAPKKKGPLLNLVKNNPLADLGEKNSGAKHLPGIGKHPVQDLVKRVLGGGHDKDSDDDNGGDTGEPAAS